VSPPVASPLAAAASAVKWAAPAMPQGFDKASWRLPLPPPCRSFLPLSPFPAGSAPHRCRHAQRWSSLLHLRSAYAGRAPCWLACQPPLPLDPPRPPASHLAPASGCRAAPRHPCLRAPLPL
jgi:hypothetical protein